MCYMEERDPEGMITIILTDRQPVIIREEEWPLVAGAALPEPYEPELGYTIQSHWLLAVRHHPGEDGEKKWIVYGWARRGASSIGKHAGYLLRWTAAMDSGEVVRTIRKVCAELVPHGMPAEAETACIYTLDPIRL